ncbi:MAG: alpha-1,2-fucosyltransferase [Bacteroidota bacterium]
MFIYACSRSIAKKRNLTYCLSNIDNLKYFKLSISDYLFNSLKYRWFQFQNFIRKYKFEHLQDNRKDYFTNMQSETAKNVWYYGYFQGERYFFEDYNEIKKVFSIKILYQKKFDAVIQSFPKDKKILVVHVRLRDYKTFGPDYLNGPDMTLPFSYYHQLLQSFNLEKYHTVFTSDDIVSVKKEFNKIQNAYFSENDAITDFQLLKSADIAIISNSTFAWWAAWLNEKTDKQIYVPEYFLGFKVGKEYPVNIIPAAWNKVKVK